MSSLHKLKTLRKDIQTFQFFKAASKCNNQIKSSIRKNVKEIEEENWPEVKRISVSLYQNCASWMRKLSGFKVSNEAESIKTTYIQALDELRQASIRGIQSAEEKIAGKNADATVEASIRHMNEYTRITVIAIGQLEQLNKLKAEEKATRKMRMV